MLFLKKIKTLPRIIILGFDIFLVVYSVILGYFIRFNFQFSLLGNYELMPSLIFFMLWTGIFMFIFKTYSGIIRHTELEDLIRIFMMIVVAYFLYYLIFNLRFYMFSGFEEWMVPLSVALIASMLLFIFMISFRVLVKLFFKSFRLDHQTKNPKKAAIYGAGELGRMVYMIMMNDNESQFKPIAFVDDQEAKSGKYISGKKIYYGLSGLKYLLDREEIDQLIIATKYLNHKRKLEIFDLCNEFNIPCKVVSSPRDWVQGKLSLGDIRPITIEDLLGREEIKLINPKIGESIKGKIVLVTGAAGSIGSELSRQLIQLSPSKLLLLDFAETPLYDLEQEFKNSPFSVDWEIILCDIRDKDKLTGIFEIYQPDLLFHAAAYKHVPMMEMYPEEAIGTNVFGTRNLVNLAVDYQLSNFVMVSTDKAVNPTNVMGASKRLSEMYTQSMAVYLEEIGSYKTKFITTRFGNVLGSNGSVLPLFKRQLESGGPITVTHKDIIRYFMTIPEACQLVLEASIMGNGGEIFVFDMGDPIRIYDLAKKYIELSGKEVGKDIQIVFTGLRPGEKMYEELFNIHEQKIPTYHDKINIAKVSSEDLDALKIKLQKLEECFKMNNKEELVRTLLQIVPEFTSSKYDLLKND